MAYEYLSQVQSSVRRINDRMRNLTERLGSDNPLVGELESKLDIFFGDNVVLKDGIYQLSKPSELFNDSEKNELLDMFESTTLPTWGEIRHQYEQQYNAYQTNDLWIDEDIDIEEFIDVQMSLPQALEWMYSDASEDAQQALEIMQQDGRRKSYQELSAVIGLSRGALE